MISDAKITNLSYNKTINVRGKLISLEKPLVMGILNLTHNSFYDGGKYVNNLNDALLFAQNMIEQGADIIDIGACSTHPGTKPLEAKEELEQILPVLRQLRKQYPDITISIDTFLSEVAKQTIMEGADIINDISGGVFDKELLPTVAELNCPYILMHTSAMPENMQENTSYNNIFLDISSYFSSKIQKLRELGVKDIILDLGFGFGKTIEQNYYLLNHIMDFRVFSLPILTGISRKSMIYRTLETTPQEALNGTTFLHYLALENGSNILRVHDVLQAKECIKLFEKVKQNN
ncbi:MAG: dihydropteroate synthase [Bacteroidales bacterium]|jgi:dihydropteroate synthase|nr:dihydropteroate synthase [Bacteroidales bacterium]